MTALELLNQWFEHMRELNQHETSDYLNGYRTWPGAVETDHGVIVLCEARCESGTGAGTCPTCGTVYR